MQFAEMASEVHIERIDPIPRELRLTPGQKKAKEAIQEALRKASSKTDLTHGQAGMNPVYSLGPSWPNVEVRRFFEMRNVKACLGNLTLQITKPFIVPVSANTAKSALQILGRCGIDIMKTFC